MQNKSRNIGSAILLFLVICCMLFPAAEKYFSFFEKEKLHGSIKDVNDVDLQKQNWFSGQYAKDKEEYLNNNFGFRGWFVKLRNQIYYELFNELFTQDVVIGKSGYMYEIKYLRTHAGLDFIGDKAIQEKIHMLKSIQDTLAKKGTHLLVIFAPGKASYFPEYIPAPYDISATQTNYLRYIENIKTSGVNYIDFNSWFIQLKPHTEFPLYPQTGTHWSTYGIYMAFDSLSKYMEKMLGKKMALYKFDKITWQDSLMYTDEDIAKGLNLFTEFPHYKMPYPHLIWPDTEKAYKPSLLTVADSYWTGIFSYLRLPELVYKNHESWYYNQEIYDYIKNGKIGGPADVDLKQHVEQHEVLIIMATEANLADLGWHFIEDVYNMYQGGPAYYEKMKLTRKRDVELDRIKDNIRTQYTWYQNVKKQAESLHITVDSCLQINALYMYNMYHKNDSAKGKN